MKVTDPYKNQQHSRQMQTAGFGKSNHLTSSYDTGKPSDYVAQHHLGVSHTDRQSKRVKSANQTTAHSRYAATTATGKDTIVHNYTHRHNELSVTSMPSQYLKSSSRKIGQRLIPSIDYGEPLAPTRPYSSSVTALKMKSLAHRKNAAEITSKCSLVHKGAIPMDAARQWTSKTRDNNRVVSHLINVKEDID